MKTVQDIRTDNGELVIANGDFLLTDSDNTHIESILMAEKGHYRQHPLCGVGVKSFQSAPLAQSVLALLRKRIEMQLKLDGYAITKIEINPTLTQESIHIKANRN
ncbi:MAG: hypothetical protein K1X92_08990 [Bacteroidia bacterium]|nr:hypothetical protein [Bacteroidia bacterium]